MEKRRRFLRRMIGIFTGISIWGSPLAGALRRAWAKVEKIILPEGTRMRSLIGQNPANLDTRNLKQTPLEEFGTMGLDDHKVDIETWRLQINGMVHSPVDIRYSQLTEIASVKREVLLICPGFFAYNALWEGVSVAKLLDTAGLDPAVTHISFSGPSGRHEKSEKFPVEDIISDKVFLACRVNGQVLPQKHGFPLRLVAEGYYGNDWVKYVDKIMALKS